MKKTTVSICIIALLVGLLCGCSNKAKEQTDTLRIMAIFKTENLDPTVGTSHDPNLMSSVFGALIRRGENRSLEPAIIQDWTMSEDALETTFTIREGVKFSDGSDLTADDVIFSLDKMKEDPAADMSEIAKGVDDSYSAVQGNFTTKESEDEDEDSSSEAYPDEVLKVLRGLKDGEVADNIIETDTGYYVVRLDKINDEDATASKRESLQNSKESTYFTDTTAKWLDEADVKVVKKVIKTLKITDKHTFMAPTPTPVPETPTPEVTEEATPTPETEEVTETPAAEDTDVTETPAAEEEAEATETPEATPTEAAK